MKQFITSIGLVFFAMTASAGIECKVYSMKHDNGGWKQGDEIPGASLVLNVNGGGVTKQINNRIAITCEAYTARNWSGKFYFCLIEDEKTKSETRVVGNAYLVGIYNLPEEPEVERSGYMVLCPGIVL